MKVVTAAIFFLILFRSAFYGKKPQLKTISGIIKIDTSRSPVTEIPEKFFLHTIDAETGRKPMYKEKKEQQDGEDLIPGPSLVHALSFITGKKSDDFPESWNRFVKKAPALGLKIYRINRLQGKAVQVLIVNGIPVLARMAKRSLVFGRDPGGGLSMYSDAFGNTFSQVPMDAYRYRHYHVQPYYYNVIFGYGPADLGFNFRMSMSREKELIQLYSLENYTVTIRLQDFLLRRYCPYKSSQRGRNAQSKGWEAVVYDAYLVLPQWVTLKILKEIIRKSFEEISFDYKTPLLEAVL